MTNILVLCTGNSCRSQMSEGYLRHFAKGKATVYSAGVKKTFVNPRAIAIMQEDGIDISEHTSNLVDEYFDIPFSHIITVCDHAKETCPYFPTEATKLHHNFFDPSHVEGSEEEITSAFRKTREEIKEFCREFVLKTLKHQ
ncbi:MAG: arsenate reductase ArsC [Chitinophagales bacterium]|nr:arsenate reductase ArsC [Chitinophagales bacterium]